MAHESWPRCKDCKGFGCEACEGGRVKPEGWSETEFATNEDGSIKLRRDGVTPIVKTPGTADFIHREGLSLEDALARGRQAP
jgi:hypothetical protein